MCVCVEFVFVFVFNLYVYFVLFVLCLLLLVLGVHLFFGNWFFSKKCVTFFVNNNSFDALISAIKMS